MTLQALTWTTLGYSIRKPLGFEQLAAFMTLRRVHLTVLAGGRSEKTVSEAMSALAGQLDERGVVGLMAHAIAMQGSPSKEITALLWERAADLALDSGFGKALDAELCLVALSCCHPFESVAKGWLVERLLRNNESASGQSFLAIRLADLDDGTRNNAALWLLNSADAPGISPTLSSALVTETVTMCEHTKDENARDEIQQMIELFTIRRDEAENRPIPSADTLARWEPRYASRHYPWMLHLLIRQPGTDGDALEAAAGYLAQRLMFPKTTGPVILALDMVSLGDQDQAPVSDEQREIALAFLNRVHPSIEYTLDIEVNIRIVTLLMQHSVGDSHPSSHILGAMGSRTPGTRRSQEASAAGRSR